MKPLFFIFFVILISSCGSGPILDKDSLLLNQDQFTELLKEIYLSEAIVQSQLNEELDIVGLYQEIYMDYGIDEQNFKDLLDFYSQDPELLESIYLDVLGRLESEKLLLDSI